MSCQALRASLIGEVDEQDRVLRHEPHQHDQADHAHDVQRVAGEVQHHRDTDERERQREHDRQRVRERPELRGQDQIDEDDRETQSLEHVRKHPVQLFRVASRHDVVARRHREPGGRGVDLG